MKSNRFKDYIAKKYIINSVIIIFLIFSMLLVSLIVNFNKTVIKSSDATNTQIVNFIGEEYMGYKKNLEEVERNKTIKKLLRDDKHLSAGYEILYDMVNDHRVRANFVLLNVNKEILATNFYESNKVLFENSHEFKRILNELDEYPIYEGLIDGKFFHNQGGKMVIGKKIPNYNKDGYILFILNNVDIEDYARYKDAEIIALVDKFDNIIYSNNDNVKNSMGKLNLSLNDKDTIYLNKILYYINEKNVNSNMRVYTLRAVEAYYQFIKLSIVFLILISAFLIVMIRIFAPEVTNRTLKPLDSLNEALSQIKNGNLDYRIENKTFDEFQFIYDSYNSMSRQIKDLVEDNNEIAERKRVMEIKNLESQFNPHFIFNIMEMLRYEIIFDPEKASNMVVTFANLMRYNINYGSKEVSIETDLKYIEDYLILQKNRFGERLNYYIEKKEEIKDLLIPKLLFQPIVENSVKYGVDCVEKLNIDIKMEIVDEKLCIKIEDNGPGIDSKKLRGIQGILSDDRQSTNHVGLYNVSRTIKLLYGEDYGLEIYSQVNRGTLVKLILPVKEMI